MQHYQASGLKERRRLTIDFYMMKTELGEHPRKFLLRVDQMVKELERVDRHVDPKDIDIVILSGLTPQYGVKVRMLESSSDWPTREWIERAVINQYEGLKSEKFSAGSRAMLSAHGHRRNDKPPIRCPLCSRTGHSTLQCREFQITRREKKPNGYQRDGEHGGNGGNGRGGKSGGVAALVEAEVVKIAAGAVVSKRKVARIPNPARRLPTPNMEDFWVVCETLGLDCSSPQALARHEDEYWVADNGATESMTQDSSNLEDYTPPPPGDEVESAGGVFIPVAGYRRLRGPR